MAKTICWIQLKKRIEAQKNDDQDEKALYNLTNDTVYGKAMENLRNRIDVKLFSYKKDHVIWASKLSYMSHKIFDNDLMVIRRNEVTLTLNKPAYIGMCILELNKVLIYELDYDYVNNKYGNNSRINWQEPITNRFTCGEEKIW